MAGPNILNFASKVVFLNGLPLTLPVATSDPGSANAGDLYYNSTSNIIRYYNGSLWENIGSGGTVTSVALAEGSESGTNIFTISGSPVTGSGTIDISLASQSQNLVLASPNGSSGQPQFRSLVAADLPSTITSNTSGTASNITATTNSTLTTLSSLSLPGSQVSGNISGNAANVTATSNSTLTTLSALSLPTSQLSGSISLTSQVSGILPIANGGTNASSAATAFANLSPMTTAGDIIYENSTPAPARLAIGSAGQVLTVVSGLPAWVTASVSPSSIALTDNHILVGNGSNLAADVAMSGDATIVASGAITLATVNSNVGSFGSSTSIPSFTVNAKGLITAASSNAVVAPAGTLSGSTLNSSVTASSLTSLGVQAQALNMGSFQINNLANGVASTDAINLGQLQAAISGLYWQGPAKAYAASNVPLTGGATLTIDGYSAQNGDLVILGNQTTASQNGEYTVSGIGSTYVLTPNGLPTAAGDAWLILNGTVYGDSAFVANAAVPSATFTEFAGPTAYTFTAPLSLSGRTVSLLYGNGLTLSSNTLIANLSGTGALAFSGSAIAAQTDGSTIGINGSNQLYVISGGISNTQIASGAAIAYTKLAALSANIIPSTNASGFLESSSSVAETLLSSAFNRGLTISNVVSEVYVDSSTLADNSSATAVVAFQFAAASFAGEEICYVIENGASPSLTRIGTIRVVCASDGSNPSLSDMYSESADCGVNWTATNSSGTISVNYITTNQGSARTMRADVKMFRR